MSAFDDIFAGGIVVDFDYHGVTATYVGDGGAASSITVVAAEEEVGDVDEYASRNRVRERGRTIRVKLSDVAEPRKGHMITIDGVTWAVIAVEALGNGVATLRCERDQRVHAGGRRL